MNLRSSGGTADNVGAGVGQRDMGSGRAQRISDVVGASRNSVRPYLRLGGDRRADATPRAPARQVCGACSGETETGA
jgi:hypothetical protein